MRRSALVFLVLCCATLFPNMPAKAQPSFRGGTIKVSVAGGSTGVPSSSGTLTLSPAGATFESSDYVFEVPPADIAAVEYHGARMDFLTIELDSHSKMIAGYRPLISTRPNALKGPVYLLVFQLDPGESVAADVKLAASFQAFAQEVKAARERTVVGAAAVDPAVAAAHPSLGKTVHAIIQNKQGLLTFFPGRLQFDGQDVRILLPLAEIGKIDPAGARETFLRATLADGAGKSRLGAAYSAYTVCCDDRKFQFVLSPEEPIAPAFRLAVDFQQYAETVRAGREQGIVHGAERNGSAATTAGSRDSNRRELGRYDAGFLEHHNPSSKFMNSLKVIAGIPGTVVLFDTGVGYVSAKPDPQVKAPRKAFLQDGYLKFLVPSTAIASVSDVSVVLDANGGGGKSNSYIAEIDVDRSSPFFEQNKSLFAESEQDNRIFLAFRDRTSLTLFLRSVPHGRAARDSF